MISFVMYSVQLSTNFLFAEVSTNTQETPSLFIPIFLMIGIFLIFYFLTIRPQQKRQNQLKKQIDSLQKGDYVISSGGMKIEIVQMKEDTFIGKIDKDIKVEFQKWCITAVLK